MGLLQKAVETYDAHRDLVGVSKEGKETLAPIAHWTVEASIEIMLDKDGNFIGAQKVSKGEKKIPIPVTEESENRTSKKIAPHGLCDRLKYLAPFGGERYQRYVEQLEEWNNSTFSHPKLAPILIYVKKGLILKDLSEEGAIQLREDGQPRDDSLIVRWRIMLHDGKDSACWTDRELMDAFSGWYLQRRSEGEKSLCMISGQITSIAKQHPKGVVASKGNAKLISTNDETGFTFRGRFSDGWQAATVGYEVSQKAHNALHWLIANQGKNYDHKEGSTFLCWNPQGVKDQPPLPSDPLCENAAPCFEPSDYQKELHNTLMNKQNGARLTGTETQAMAIYAVFDAATKGRLALTGYHEFLLKDYLQRLYQWDSMCCWENGELGIQSPSLPQIVDNTFGTQRKVRNKDKEFFKMETDDSLFSVQLQRLIAIRLSNVQRIPADIARILAERASSPQSYVRSVWQDILFTACAVVKKYRYDQFKEEWNVTLDEGKQDTSYLFGRLLAIAEKVERDTYSDGEMREPNAIRMMTVFSRRPLHTYRHLHDKLIPYFSRLDRKSPKKSREYRSMMEEIFTALYASGKDLTRPLEDTYLLGYYCQRKALHTSKKEQNEEE